MDRIKNSAMIDSRFINLKPLKFEGPNANPYTRCWVLTARVLPGVLDLRPRIGTFSTPWEAPGNPWYRAPEFKFIPDRLSDLADQRAISLCQKAKQENKKIVIMWSGGIDSTFVLSSFIKNLSQQDLSLLNISTSTSAIVENFSFYKKFISNKITCTHYSKLDITDDFLDNNILLHGDPGDCLFGPSISMYRGLLANNQHQESYKRHLKSMAEHVQPVPGDHFYVENFGEWWVNKVTENIENSNISEITTVADWWWWTYYNLKWEFSCQRPMVFNRRDFTNSISTKNLKSFAEDTFFAWDQFQLWSYSNLKNLIGNGRSDHKREAKKYIYDLDKNERYLKYKSKLAGTPANIIQRTGVTMPMCYDQNWKGHYGHQLDLNEQACFMLQRYKG